MGGEQGRGFLGDEEERKEPTAGLLDRVTSSSGTGGACQHCVYCTCISGLTALSDVGIILSVLLIGECCTGHSSFLLEQAR